MRYQPHNLKCPFPNKAAQENIVIPYLLNGMTETFNQRGQKGKCSFSTSAHISCKVDGGRYEWPTRASRNRKNTLTSFEY